MAADISASQTNLNTGPDETRLVVDVTRLAPNTKAIKQEHDRSRKAKRRKLKPFHCLIRVEVFSQGSNTVGKAGLYCLAKEATLTTEEDEKSIFGFELDEPFTINTTSLLIRTPRSSGIGWSRSLVQDYEVTISILFHNDTDMNEVLELADLKTNDGEVVLASTFRISCGGTDGDARRAQLKSYTTTGSITTNLNMVAEIAWKKTCQWCAEEQWFATGAVLDEHIATQHPWAPKTDALVIGSDNVDFGQATLNGDLSKIVTGQSISARLLVSPAESKSSFKSVTATSTATRMQAVQDSAGLSTNGDQHDLATQVEVRKLLDATSRTWSITQNDLKDTFGSKNMLDRQFIEALHELAAVTTFEAAKAAILRVRKLKHYSRDLKQCTLLNIKEAVGKLRPRGDLQRSPKLQAGDDINAVAMQTPVIDGLESSAETLRSSKLNNRGEGRAGQRNPKDLPRRDAQDSDDRIQTTNAKRFRSQSEFPAKPSPFQAARHTTTSFGLRDPKTVKTGHSSFNGFDTARRRRDDRHKRVIPESPSTNEESLLETRQNARIDSGMELDEAPKEIDVVKYANILKRPSAPRAPNVINSTSRTHKPLDKAVIEQPQGQLRSWAIHGLPQPRFVTTTVPSRPSHASQLFEETTFRPLLPRSEVTDYEHQIDNTWLRMKQDQKIDARSNMTSTQKSLMKRWNHQMLEEKLNGNKFLPDATMRFAAASRSWLKEDAAFREFVRFLGSLRADKLVSDGVIKACVNALRGTKLSTREHVGLLNNAKAGTGINVAASTKTSALTSYLQLPVVPEAPYIAEKRSDWATTCLCGGTVDGTGQIVLCSNIVSL